ncbi:MAG TPA: hypothetical protein DIV79_04790 [Opitutae bacterium]|nr:hypothetical protein [Opitutaceae bacterium]HCR29318.1 hypothetical protein [Opitutae bacterium]
MKRFLPLITIALTIIQLRAIDENPPNFVYIIADDLGWADVAFHGGNAPIAHLERLLNPVQYQAVAVTKPASVAANSFSSVRNRSRERSKFRIRCSKSPPAIFRQALPYLIGYASLNF